MSNTAKNDVTGDKIQSKTNSDSFRDNFDKIFKKTVENLEEQKQKESLWRKRQDGGKDEQG